MRRADEPVGLAGVDLNLLVVLDALLTERNVTRAAERMSVGQPAMSASLARLRKHFDDPLLVREGRQLVPTPLAESLSKPVREAVVAAEAVLGVSKEFDPSTDSRSFTVVASDFVTLVLLRPLLGQLASEAPGVRINVTPVHPDYTDQLRTGQVDLLIVPTAVPPHRFGFPHQMLFTERYVLAADRDHPDLGTEVTVEQLTRLPYVAYSGGPLPSIAESELDALGVELQIEVSTQTFLVIPFLLSGTRLVSMVHERLARMMADQAGLRMLTPPVPLSTITEAMYWNPRHNDDPAHRWLRERLAALAAAI